MVISGRELTDHELRLAAIADAHRQGAEGRQIRQHMALRAKRTEVMGRERKL